MKPLSLLLFLVSFITAVANTASDFDAVVRIQGADTTQGGTGTLVGKSQSGDFLAMTFLATDHTARRVGPLTTIGFGNVATPKLNLSLASAVYTNTTYFGSKDMSVIGMVIRLSSLTAPEQAYLLSLQVPTLSPAPGLGGAPFDFFTYSFGRDGAGFPDYGTQNTFTNRVDSIVAFSGSYTVELPSGTALNYTQNHLEWDLDVPGPLPTEGTVVQGGSGSPIIVPALPNNLIVGIQVNGSLTPGAVNYGVAFNAADVSSINAVIAGLSPTVKNWNGTGTWNTAVNWTGSGLPREYDFAGIQTGTCTLNVDATVASMNFVSGGRLIGQAGNPRAVSINGNLSVANNALIGGTAPITLNANGTMAIESNWQMDNVTLNRPAETTTTQSSTGGNSSVSNGTIINNAGIWNATGISGLSYLSGAASPFNNIGTFNRSVNPGEWFTSMAFNNTGTVNVNTGILRLGGGGASTGAFAVSSGALLYFGGTAATTFTSAASFTGAGTVRFEITGSNSISQYDITGATTITSGTLTFNNVAGAIGALTVSGGTGNFNGTASPTALTINGGTASFANNTTLPAGATVNGGTVNMAATKSLTIPGMLTWTGGTLGGGGGTFHANGGITSASGAGRVDAATLVLPMGATMTQSGSNTLELRNGATWTNSGTFIAQVGSFISNGPGVNAFTNTGTFTRSGAAGTYLIGVPFHNNGIVNANVGTLTLNNGGTSPGLFNVGTGTTLVLAGAHILSGSTTFAGAGTVSFGASLPITLTNYDVTGGTTITSGNVTLNNNAGSLGAVLMSSGTGNFNGMASPTAYTINGGTANFANNTAVPTATLNGGTTNVPSTKTFQINGAVTWTGGTLTGGGAFIVEGNVTANSGFNTLNGATFQLAAGRTLTQSGANTLNLSNGAVFNNAGTFVATTVSNTLNNGGGAASTFNNTGTFTRSTSATDYNIGVPFNNSGTVNATAGTIRMVTQTFTQTAGQLVLNGGAVRAAFNLPFLIQGGSITGAGNVLGGVSVTGGTVKPRGILAIQDTDGGGTKGDLTMTSASMLDMELGGTTAGMQHDRVTEQGNVAFARNGQLAVRFKSGYQYSIANSDTFTILNSNANTTGQFSNVSSGRVTTADFKGTFAINAAGTTSVVLSDFQGYPDIDVEQPAGADLVDGAATVPFGIKTIGTPGVVKTFTVKNTGATNLTGLGISIDGTHAAEFAVTTALPSTTLAAAGTTTFIVTFTPTGSGIRTAALHIASNDPNEATFDIALTGEGNFAPVLNLPAAVLEVEPVDFGGAPVTFTVTATDFEDDPDPTAVATPASGSQFNLGDTAVNVTVTDSRGATTTGSFIVRVLGGFPIVASLAPSAVTINGATLQATVNPNHFATLVKFVLDGNPVPMADVNVPVGATAVPVSAIITGLDPGSTHTARIDAINAMGLWVPSNTITFTTLGGPPAVTTTTPTIVTPTKARLTATVNPNDLPTTVSFYIGQQLLGTVNVPAGSSPQTVTFDYKQLIPGQTITFNAIAINQLAQTGVSGNDFTFNLLPSNTTFGNSNNFLWAANAGWVNAKSATSYGFRTGDTVCSGFLWGANIGWIHAGTGEPNNGIRYTNTGSDYGVNVMPDGKLRGYAWGQNIGWVNFENTGAPAVDLTTGTLTGYAWSANIGWINLSTATTTQLAILDTDGDGLSDAWERDKANGNLATLGTPGDNDGDGQSNLAEFAADTDPLDGNDRFRIVNFSQINNGGFVSLEFTSKTTRFYQVHDSPTLSGGSWQEVGLVSIPGEANFTSTGFNGPTATRKFYRVSAMRPLAGP